MAGKIFISYRREDSAPHALSIGQYLEHEFGRRNVFIDVDMYAGAKFPVVLERRLAACKVMLVLIGPRWLNAIDEEGHLRLDNPEDWVRLEVASALKRGITVVPVRVGGAELPKKSLLPSDMRGLLDHQATTVSTTGFRNEMAGLVRDIRAIPGQRYQRVALTAGVVCVVAMLCASLWVFKDKWLPSLWSQVQVSDGGQEQASVPAADHYSEKDYPALRPGREWVMYAGTSDGYPMYFRPDSIRTFPNRAVVMQRFRVDPTKPVANNKIIEQAAFEQDQWVYECNSNRAVQAKNIVFDVGGQTVYTYKWGDPELIDLSLGIVTNPGSVGEAMRNIVCTPELRTPLVDDQELSEMRFIPLSSTVAGDGEVFYRPEHLSDTAASALVVVRNIRETALSTILPKGTKDVSFNYKYSAQKISLDCRDHTGKSPKVAYYGSDFTLEYLVWLDNLPPSNIGETSPLEGLRRVMCSPQAVEKCPPSLPPDNDELSGIYLGTVDEGEPITRRFKLSSDEPEVQ